ncbi:Sec-independent protein translocase protein TatB [Acidisoma cladoniae]|jgi:sec-independent protein translocase protein TatB|uniref:Sec-independent protein translocase protein TatB n=1 Tax=Acidisoma cladoniae TaxID=3040935 RepID=UPI00254F54A2|nr:Sec-independent protein translocase protein TatB [Acidisoma sp. PAMC 29798]
MFDFAWSEIALVGVVALVAIGPKDMPVAIRTITGLIKKARRMAGDFQGQMDDLVREANLHEVRDSIQELRSGLNVRGQLGKMLDPDNTIKSAFADPMGTKSVHMGPISAADLPVETVAVGQFPEYAIDRPDDITADMVSDGPLTPSFIPPGITLAPKRPAFIPPGIRR